MALFFFGLYYYCFRILGFDLAYTPGDYGDSRFINYILEHGYKWLLGIEPDFWRANFMYPLKDNVAISDSMAGSFAIYSIFRLLNYNSETSLQLWWLSCCILNFWCCFIALKKIGFNLILSAIGSYVFAFGINNFNQFVHLQFICKFLVPIIIALAYLYLNKPKIKYFFLLIICLVLQFYCSPYICIFLMLFIVFFILFYFSSKTKRQFFYSQLNKKQIIQSMAALSIGVFLVLVLAIPYNKMAKEIGYLNYDYIVGGLPSFYSYFLPNECSITWDFLKNSPLKQMPNWYLQDIFPGAFCYLGLFLSFFYLIYCLIKKQKIDFLPILLFSICIVFICIFSKTESNFSLFKFIKPLPGFNSMRLTTRFMIVINFILIWLSLLYISYVNKEKNILVMIILTAFVIGDNQFNNDLTSRSLKQTRYKRTLQMCNLIKQNNPKNKKIIAVLNLKNEDETYQLDVMLATQKLNLYSLNGYSSTCYDQLCLAYSDPKHLKLSAWLKKYWIKENEVVFINLDAINQLKK